MLRIVIILLLFAIDCHAGALIEQGNMVYKGAFRVPRGNLGGDSDIYSMGRGGRGITYNPANNSLIMLGSSNENLAIEISIPEEVNSTDINALNTATVIQVPGDVANGQWSLLNLDHSAVENGGVASALLVYNNKLVGGAYPSFADGSSGHLSHFTASLTWATSGSQFSGLRRVGTSIFGSTYSNAGFTGGYMCHVPAEWQTALGVPVLTGNGAIPINGRTSWGPGIWGFDPNDIADADPVIVPATNFVTYTESHPTLGGYYWSDGTLYYNLSTNISGIAFPSGTDSVLVVGMTGLGEYGTGVGCYGVRTTDPELHRTPVGDGDIYCYDPVNGDKGGHSYPYVHQVWAYDANDLLDVKNGTKQYWEVVPYAIWNFTLPFTNENSSTTGQKLTGGVAYNPTTQRLYISQLTADTWADEYEPNPIIHVFQLQLGQSLGTVLLGHQ